MPTGAVRPATLAAAAAALGVAAVAFGGADGDPSGDVFGPVGRFGLDLARLRWQFALVVLALGLLHYVAAAVAARAAAGINPPLRETVLAQLAASTADRVVPGGLGAAAVNARYFHRSGMTLPAALGAVASLHVLGPLTDAGVLAFIVLAGATIGLPGGMAELTSLTSTILRPLTSLPSAAALLGVLGLALLVAVWRRRRRGSRSGADWRTFWTPVRQLVTCPARLLALAAGSAGTTLVLALAFAASVAAVPGRHPAIGLGALMIAFMLGATAGNAVPIPGGMVVTELALVSLLVGLRVPSAVALQDVLVFRIVTFWLPGLTGIFAARHLRRSGTL